MSKSQLFDLNSIKRMTIDSLMKKCKQYVERYLPQTDAFRFDEAYKNMRFDEVKVILEKTFNRIKTKIDISEIIYAVIINEFPDAKEVLKISDIKEEDQEENMEASNEMNAIIIISVAIIVVAVIGAILYHNRDKSKTVKNQLVSDVMSPRSNSNYINYTDKDKDLMELIHELSLIYDNTDKYLKS